MTDLHRGFVIEELPDFIAPWNLRHVFDGGPMVLLENPGEPSTIGRYSFLCGDPFLVFQCKRDQVQVGPPGALQPVPGNPLDVLGELMRKYRAEPPARSSPLPPFLGGAAGYLGYELLYSVEPSVPDRGEDDLATPDACLLFCTSTIAADLMRQRTWLITQAFAPTAERAQQLAEEAMRSLSQRAKLPPLPSVNAQEVRQWVADRRRSRWRLDEEGVRAAGFTPRVTRAQYLESIQRAKEHILAGDIFELCMTQRFEARCQGDGQRLYEVLRTVNPAPFAAYLRLPEVEVMSASMERFVSLNREGWAQTRPIKGTRPRGKTPEEDAQLQRELETSLKDRAENVMIVDLSRNDLGRVCRFGTVRAPELMVVEPHTFTFQLVSTVVGQLNPGLGPVDLLKAAFPGGSMTGAPKVEAMKIIDSLEPVKRGVFSGAIGYIDFEGAMDLSIVIRTFVKRDDALTFHVGGAIVTDSDPVEEYQETLDKAHGLITAFEMAQLLSSQEQPPPAGRKGG